MIIKYECNNPECPNSISKLFKNHREIPNYLDCGECGVGKLERVLGAALSKTIMTIDNGSQSRAVEVSSVIVEKEIEKARSE